MTHQIDTEAAVGVVTAWSQLGDVVASFQGEVEHMLTALMMLPIERTATRALAFAANELWRAATFVSLAVDAVLAADTFDIGSLMPQPDFTYTPGGGDLDGTYDTQLRAPYAAIAADAVSVARDTFVRALMDTDNDRQIRPDEFELVQLSETQFMVVLPGVTDLSNGDLGLSDLHRSVRDLDESAIRSWFSVSSGGNNYAEMLAPALLCAGVPPDSELVIVGHSYGAETAFDLAADSHFNGELYNVTYVLAAGYSTSDRIDRVQPHTSVLSLENNRDLVVSAEQGLDRGPFGALARGFQWEAKQQPADGVHRVTVDFDGGFEGFGHDPSSYAKFLESTDDPQVLAFMASFGAAAGLATASAGQRRLTTGTARAVDVSVPREQKT